MVIVSQIHKVSHNNNILYHMIQMMQGEILILYYLIYPVCAFIVKSVILVLLVIKLILELVYNYLRDIHPACIIIKLKLGVSQYKKFLTKILNRTKESCHYGTEIYYRVTHIRSAGQG